MENIKEKLSDVAHSWSVIGMITLFLFGVQPETMTTAEALIVKPEISKAQQAKLQAQAAQIAKQTKPARKSKKEKAEKVEEVKEKGSGE